MNPEMIVGILHQSLIVALKMSVPIMLIALTIGVFISIIQALTQIQEATLTFVPKMIAVFIGLFFLMPFMGTTLVTFTQGLFDTIVHME